MKACYFTLVILMTLQLKAQEKVAPSLVLQDSIITSISTRYEPRSFLHQLVMGKNYRKSWSTPVKLPVLHFAASGFVIERQGGGQQTKSLHLLDKNGGHWLLRKVDKEVEAALPAALKNKPGRAFVQDMISASLPYSHIIVGNLAKAASIEAPMPQIVFVADEKSLKEYRHIFANQVCTLEATVSEEQSFDTEIALAKIAEDNNNRLLQKQILKVRLLDMLIGDWDRHDGQWQWVYKDSVGKKFFYVIPKDRDNAFFHATGLLPTITKNSFMTHFKAFKKNSKGLNQLNRKAIVFDEYFLNELDAGDWEECIQEFQQQINDSVIVASIKTLPGNVYALYGQQLISKLKSRRDGLMKNGLKYYRYLAGAVDIRGSDKEDLFVASGDKDQMIITVYRLDGNREKIFERKFKPSETNSIVLNGLRGADRFVIEERPLYSFRLKIYDDRGKTVNRRSEVGSEKSEVGYQTSDF